MEKTNKPDHWISIQAPGIDSTFKVTDPIDLDIISAAFERLLRNARQYLDSLTPPQEDKQ